MDQSAPGASLEKAARASIDPTVTLYVCVKCLGGEESETEPRAGARLHQALIEAHSRHDGPPGFRIAPAECLSNCNRGCSVALSGPGRWSYVYGDLSETCAAEILAGAHLYAAATDGLVPWRDRPAIFRKGVIARIPPLEPAALEPAFDGIESGL